MFHSLDTTRRVLLTESDYEAFHKLPPHGPRMKSIAIVDWGWVGHVPLYAENLCRVLEAAEWRVHHVCPTPDEAERDLCVAGNLSVTCHALDEPTTDQHAPSKFLGFGRRKVKAEVGRSLMLRSTFQRLSRTNHHFDFVFLPWLDLLMSDQLTPDDLPDEFESGWGGILINASMFSSVATAKQRRAKLLRKYQLLKDTRLRLLATLDELALSNLTQRYSQASVRWMPDLIEAPVTARSMGDALHRARASGKQVLVSVGVMHRRKGYLKLLRIAEAGMSGGWFFLIAGPVAGDDLSTDEQQLVRRAIEGGIPNVAVVDQQLPTTAVNAFIDGADAVFLGYEDWYQSSNIMTRASCLKTPVFSCPQGLLADRTRRFQLGWILPDLSADAIASTLQGIGRQELMELQSRADFDRYATDHHVNSLADTMLPLLNNEGCSGVQAA
ncbi:MAG: hypothetical protein ACR2NZ_01085 [Rubripirellula sp.]